MIISYELDARRCIILYSVGNQLFFRIKQGEMIGNPNWLANDYGKNLSGCVYQNSVFFTYESIRHEHIVRNVNQSTGIFYGQENIGKISLWKLGEQLWAFYSYKEQEQWSLRCKCLSQDGKEMILVDSEMSREFTGILMDNCVVILQQEVKNQVLLVDENLHVTIYQPENEETIRKLNEMIKKKDSEIEKMRNMIQSATQQYNDLKGVAEQYRNEAIHWRSKFL